MKQYKYNINMFLLLHFSSSSQQSKPTTQPETAATTTTEIISRDIAKIAEKNVIAVFVARFDVLHGNIIEWQYPKGK